MVEYLHNMKKERLLLHCCCGPCATASIERLMAEETPWEIVLFYTNSNIFPNSEFDIRYEELKKVASHFNVELIREEPNHEAWLDAINGYENEAEGFTRCSLCFSYNLNKTYLMSKKLNINYFTTTLSVSRFKKSDKIFLEGEKYPGFLKIDFKKKDGFARSCKLAEELNLYRQNYCGCEFSKRG